MKAIIVREFGSAGVLKLQQCADPEVRPDHVVVRLHAAGVNPVDTYIRSGTYAQKPELPYTPGIDGAGIIEAVGANVVGVTVGQRVWIAGTAQGPHRGTYAEKALCHAAQVYSLPDNLTFSQGAAINVAYVTAFRALFDRAKTQSGEVVLVHGASGGVGIAALQLAVNHGCIVFGTAGTEEGLELVRSQGAAGALDHTDSDYLAELLRRTNNRGPDVIIEMLANVNLDKDLAVIAPSGRIVVVGNRGRVEIDARHTMGKEAIVTGMTYWSGGDSAVRQALAAVQAGLVQGVLKPVVAREFPLSDAAKAHEAVMKSGARGKIVLTM